VESFEELEVVIDFGFIICVVKEGRDIRSRGRFIFMRRLIMGMWRGWRRVVGGWRLGVWWEGGWGVKI